MQLSRLIKIKEQGVLTSYQSAGIGWRLPEAIALYEKSGYRRTENYGQYVGVENSVCFAKGLGD
ncbi:hypothetical protein SAMN05216327_11493 [Dyadobacter sp. SG02]|uniref:hypothetical protein n=1 Tax=Dyadobacter sp. SG02 TaxID=1855291 RepID=UPI0008AC5416|nr:hypothetical protein [Dyadobacter sp. SG02]SEJ61953.1 hypothetical protein SAMN05216327_11493 [Dyadobacter sp. SG02]